MSISTTHVARRKSKRCYENTILSYVHRGRMTVASNEGRMQAKGNPAAMKNSPFTVIGSKQL